jgi:hypothetical protein
LWFLGGGRLSFTLKLKNGTYNMSNRAVKVASFVSDVKAHADQNRETEWNLLGTMTDEEIVSLIGDGRKMNRVLEGVGQKLRVLKAGLADLATVSTMSYQTLIEFEVNKKVKTEKVAEVLAIV